MPLNYFFSGLLQIQKDLRLRHIDFLRGIAIILVLIRHTPLFSFTTNVGWIGVDLFFVLSGFLVSGLLFKEFIKFGEVKPIHFLIRRGFKIYPVFWLALILFLCLETYKGKPIIWPSFIGEILFLQNYISGWGYAINGVSWSLAVEEHFYIGLAFIIPVMIRKKWIDINLRNENYKIESAIFIIMLATLFMRVLNNYFFPANLGRNFTMTHLRIDSLLAGVLISYWYYFKKELFVVQYNKYKKLILPFALILLSFTPFIQPISSFFVETIGFTMVFAGFSLILIYFILNPDINKLLDRLFTKQLVYAVSKVGYYSYSIYLFHAFVNNYFDRFSFNPFLHFIICNITSILVGILVSHYIEYYFLRVRDLWYPARR